MRGWLAIGLVLVLLLSGCAQKSPSSASSSNPGSSSALPTAPPRSGATATSAPTAPHPAANATNHVPTAAIAAKTGNGTAALNVTFTLSGHDADGDALNWTLAYGDGNRTAGSALPANATHAYGAGGLYNVTLTVTDGRNATVATVRLNLTAASHGPPQVASGAWPLGADGCLSPTHLPSQDGIQYLAIDVEPRTIGLPWTATVEATIPALFYGLGFQDAAGDDIADSGAFGTEATLSGTVPAGAVTALLFTCGGADMAGTYTAG
ncbi:MAG: PKD domain-containing protein [Thermoplasmatota archaeon]